MEIQSAFNSGVTGFRNATELATESASEIARQSVDDFRQVDDSRAVEDPQNTNNSNSRDNAVKPESKPEIRESDSVTEELVNLRVAEHQAQASVKVIATADEIVGSLIDTRV